MIRVEIAVVIGGRRDRGAGLKSDNIHYDIYFAVIFNYPANQKRPAYSRRAFLLSGMNIHPPSCCGAA
jgi:hypothetical protein